MMKATKSAAVLILTLLSYNNGEELFYTETLINETINSAIAFEYPQDASEYKPISEENFGLYDFIIIGAGSTGSVLANRLSENNKWKVLLLEAGEFGNDATDIPAMQQATLSSKFNWGYESIPQKTCCLGEKNQKCFYNKGKGVGGTTLFNGLSYTRGSPTDFDKWAQLSPGWSYAEVLPYFKKSENFVKTDPDAVADYESHGFGGALNVEFRIPRHPQTSRWLRANREIGHKIIDHNGKNSIGASIAQINKKNGKRQDTGSAFIKPIRNRPNLKISTQSFVTKIVISNETKTAKGVQFVYKGQTYLARTRKEVILSAGVISSSQILMLSGIGPAKHLHQIGIPVVEDLEVGTTLRDHPMFGFNFDSNYTRNDKSLTQYVEAYLEGRGTATVPDDKNGFGFYQTKFETHPNYPDIQIVMIAQDGFAKYVSQQLSSHQEQPVAFTMLAIVLHAKSVGTVRLRSNNPFDYPLIDSNVLSDNIDMDTLYEGLKMALKIANTAAYQEVNTTIIPPRLPACGDKAPLSKDFWYCAFRQTIGVGYHAVGSCPMGSDPKKGAVVDGNCKVYGIRNLRVADASVFPFTLSGHPSAPCMMIGEKIADVIKDQYKLSCSAI